MIFSNRSGACSLRWSSSQGEQATCSRRICTCRMQIKTTQLLLTYYCQIAVFLHLGIQIPSLKHQSTGISSSPHRYEHSSLLKLNRRYRKLLILKYSILDLKMQTYLQPGLHTYIHTGYSQNLGLLFYAFSHCLIIIHKMK